MRLLPLILLALAMPVLLTGSAEAGIAIGDPTEALPRQAVVIGNGDYDELSPLATPRNDATLVAQALRDVGFDVVLIIDADRQILRQVSRTLPLLFQPDSIGLFYYSGHAAQIDGASYLLPTDAVSRSRQQLMGDAVALSAISQRAQLAGIALHLVMLDTNRPDPTLSQLPGIETTLGAVNVNGNEVFTALATAPGAVAPRAPGQTSPFASAFAEALGEAGLDVVDVFRIVRRSVRERTGGNQIPWNFASLVSDFRLNPVTQGAPEPGRLITTCDLFAAAPEDPNRVAPGIDTAALDGPVALRECERAVVRNPTNPRFQFQFARTVETVGTVADSLDLYKAAAASGYPAAIQRLSTLGVR